MKEAILAQRRFFTVLFILTVSTFALFFDKLGGGEWVAIATLALSVLTAGIVAQKKVEK